MDKHTISPPHDEHNYMAQPQPTVSDLYIPLGNNFSLKKETLPVYGYDNKPMRINFIK